MRFSTRYPRHLSARSPRERGAVLGQFLLIAITIVIGGLLAMAVTRHGEPAATETPVAPEAQSKPTSPPPTAGTPATAWVRASRPGTAAELNLVEYVGERRLSTDTSGVVLPGGDWQHLEVTHVTHRPGSELSVEVVVPDLAQRAGVALDDLQVRLGSTTKAFVPETTSR